MASSGADPSDTAFEVGFPGPSLDNPLLFAEYAKRVEDSLRRSHPAESGYRLKTSAADDPKNREWTIGLYHGLVTGAKVRITPLRDAPHRARVSVEWDSRLFGALVLTGMVLAAPVALLLFVLLLFVVRLLGALVAVGILVILWVVLLTLVAFGIARLVARLAGDEFDEARRREIASSLRHLPLPRSTGS